MAKLWSPEHDQTVELVAETSMGRGDQCRLRVDDVRVSSLHALIRWTGSAWEVRDLGSRNGTFVNGVRLEPGGQSWLSAGSTIQIGAAEWILRDATPPRPWISTDRGERIEPRHGDVLRLPEQGPPAAWVVRSGADTWCVEDESGVSEVKPGEPFPWDGRSWTLNVPEGARLTQDTGHADIGWRLHARVSTDEETVEIELRGEAGVARLEPRAHSYMLLVLARAWAEDERAAPWDRGWLLQEELERRLAIPRRTLNTHVHRARRQLDECGLDGASDLLQRRHAAGQLRIAVDRVLIERSSAGT